MRIDILTLFPSMFDGPMTESMVWKARDRALLDLRLHNIRDWTTDPHRTVDDTPYGGGGGMIMKPDVVSRALESVIEDSNIPVLLMTPQGRLFNHDIAVELAAHERIVILCGRYEGIDDRVRELLITDEISIGDYVLTGGELPAMVIIDAVIRHIPGVLGSDGAADRDSHANGILEGAHYTRPPVFRGLAVPDELQGGDHAAVERWRHEDGLRKTWHNRPELLRTAVLSPADKMLLAKFAREDAARTRKNG